MPVIGSLRQLEGKNTSPKAGLAEKNGCNLDKDGRGVDVTKEKYPSCNSKCEILVKYYLMYIKMSAGT